MKPPPRMLLIGVLLLLGCSEPAVREPAVRVTASQVPMSARGLLVEAVLNGVRPQRTLRFDLASVPGQGTVRFGLWLPAGSEGQLSLWIQAVSEAGCILATGGGEGTVDLLSEVTVALDPLLVKDCVQQLPIIDSAMVEASMTAEDKLVTVRGQGFREGVRVLLAGRESAEVIRVSSQQLRFRGPSLTGVLGPVELVVRNPDGGEARRSDLIVNAAISIRFSNRSVGTGQNPTSASISDLNGDGLADLVVSHDVAPSLSVHLGQAKGKFSRKSLDLGTGSLSAAVADFSGDGRPDIVLASLRTESPVQSDVIVLENKGDGTFPAELRQVVPLGGDEILFTLAVGDLRRSGRPDVIFTVPNVNQLGVLLNRGDGTLARDGGIRYPGRAGFVAIADMNLDGFPDLIGRNGRFILVFINQRDGSFAAAGGAYLIGEDEGVNRCLAAADVDGDGFPELIASDRLSNTVRVVRNRQATDDGRWLGLGELRAYKVGSGPQCVAAGDVNGDGAPDLWVTNVNDDTVTLLLNRLDGTFPNQGEPGSATYPTEAQPVGVTLGDLNADGKLDALVTNHGNSSLTLLTNTSE